MSRSIEALVEHQVRRWELSRRSSVSEPPRPCVTLSRPLGAGAAELGQRVADMLGFPFFNKELVEWIARRSGHREHLVAGVDERIRNAIDRFVTDGFARERFTETDYLRQLVRIMATLGELGGAVILGRGSQFILPAERTLRALVVAPQSERVERLRKRESITAAEAEEAIQRADAGRRAFLVYHFHREPDDPGSYDLTVNTGFLSLEDAATLLATAYRLRFPASKRQPPIPVSGRGTSAPRESRTW
jgi:cytidylate kinase